MEVNESFISFRLLFDDPSLISKGSMLDIVEVNFRNPDWFVRRSDYTRLSEKSRILIQEIPRQIELDAPLEHVKQAVKATETAANFAVGSMAAGTLTGVSGATFMGAFNTIQLITMQAYTGSEMPSNAANLFMSIDEFMRGGPLNPGKLI